MNNDFNSSACFKTHCLCKYPSKSNRSILGKRKLISENFALIECKEVETSQETANYVEKLHELIDFYKGKGFKTFKRDITIQSDVLKFNATLKCKWHVICDCSATIKIQYVDLLKAFQVKWYTQSSAHAVSNEQKFFHTFDEHQHFEHIQLPNEITGEKHCSMIAFFNFSKHA